jgi:ribonuclease P protein component
LIRSTRLVAGFRANEHIRVRKDFQHIYDTGRRLPGRLMILFVRQNGTTAPRLGIAATRKIGSAVIRNRAKRLARELFRHHKPPGGLDIVVIPRREMVDASYVTLEAEFSALLKRWSAPARPPAASAGTDRDRPHPHV